LAQAGHEETKQIRTGSVGTDEVEREIAGQLTIETAVSSYSPGTRRSFIHMDVFCER
jgi:hypothetical protein